MKELSLKHTFLFLKYRFKKIDFYIAFVLMIILPALVTVSMNSLSTLSDETIDITVAIGSTIALVAGGCFPFLVVYSATAFGMEYGNKTINNLVTSKYDIIGLYFSKYLAHIIITIVYAIVSFGLAIIFNNFLDVEFEYIDMFKEGVVSLLIFSAWWFSFATFLSVTTKSFLVSIIGTLCAYFLGPNLALFTLTENETIIKIVENIPFTFANENNIGIVLETSQYIVLAVSGLVFIIISIYVLKTRPTK